MKLSKNEYEVAERDDMSYQIIQNTWSRMDPKKYMHYMVEIHYRPQDANMSWLTVNLSKNGYKTERAALTAIKKHADKHGYTLA